ncbi:hypothetical protein NLU13_7526 [Sarocladium strictum]|uniref:Uncharacterized protein n=1 Tax=Sarocladium strictum TaxID=5046 RepID=A0AA39GE55_SARSR|nr:hypothetical protein NLU13_7526 [Sarocladium strictum]
MRLSTRHSLAIIALAAWQCSADSEIGPADRTDLADLLQFLDTPNATSSQTVTGPDVSKEYPGSGSVDWVIFNKVVGNVLRSRPANNSDDDDDDTPNTALSLHEFGVTVDDDSKIRGPNNTYKAHDSWAMCTGWRSLGREYTTYPLDQDIDPSCKGLLSDKCLTWLEELAEEGTWCSQRMEGEEFWNDTPCRQEDKDAFGLNLAAERFQQLNGTAIDDMNQLLKHERPGWMTAYDEMVGWPMMVWVGFGHADDLEQDENGNPRLRESDKKVPSMFRCLRPTEFSEGSRNMTDIKERAEKSGGEGLHITTGLVAGVGCAAMVLNLFF